MEALRAPTAAMASEAARWGNTSCDREERPVRAVLREPVESISDQKALGVWVREVAKAPPRSVASGQTQAGSVTSL